VNRHVAAVSALFAVCSTIVLAWVTRPVDDRAVQFARTLNTPFAVGAILIATAAALTFGPYPGTILMLGGYVLVRLLKAGFDRRRGGIDGPGLLLSLGISGIFAWWILTSLRAAVLK
jgi:hypothetical protein